MTKGERLTILFNKLQELHKSGDTEGAHADADKVLTDFILELAKGTPYSAIAVALVDRFNDLGKWYA